MVDLSGSVDQLVWARSANSIPVFSRYKCSQVSIAVHIMIDLAAYGGILIAIGTIVQIVGGMSKR